MTTRHCQVTVSWPAEDGRTVDDVVIYNIESDFEDNQMPTDVLDGLTDLFLVSPESDVPDGSPCPPCTARITSQNLGPGRRLTLAAVDVLSSARNIELFSHTGEYLVLSEGTRLDVAGERKLYLSQHTFDQPQASCQLKFLSLVEPGRLWLHSLHITMAVSRVDPAFPIAFGPVIDMDKVTAMMADMDTEMPDRAKGLMNAMTSIQKDKKQKMSAFGSIIKGSGQGPPTMAGIMGMFASMGMGTPPAMPQTPSTSSTASATTSQESRKKDQADTVNISSSKGKSKKKRTGKTSSSKVEHVKQLVAIREASKHKNKSTEHKAQNKEKEKCQEQHKGQSKDKQKGQNSQNKDQEKNQKKGPEKGQSQDDQQKCQSNKDQGKTKEKDNNKKVPKERSTEFPKKDQQSKDQNNAQTQGTSKRKGKSKNKGQNAEQQSSSSCSAGTPSTDTDSEQSASLEIATDETGSSLSCGSDGKSKSDAPRACKRLVATERAMPVTLAHLNAFEQRLVQRIDSVQADLLEEMKSRIALSEQRIIAHMDSLMGKMAAVMMGSAPVLNGAANQMVPD